MANVRAAAGFLVLLALSGCATVQPAPVPPPAPVLQRPPAQIVNATRDIFDQILGNGLFERNGLRAMGLTAGEWGVAWQALSGRLQLARTAIDAANAESVKDTIDAAVAAHNALVHEHNVAVNWRNGLVDEFNRLTGETNTLADTLNWTE